MTALVRFRRVIPILAIVLGSVTLAPTAHGAATSATLIGVRAPGVGDSYDLGAMRSWQGKTNAVALIFRKTSVPAADLVAKMTAVWNAGSVPAYSVELVDSNASIAAGNVDAQIDGVARAIKLWLAGPDLRYGSGDDRRAYIRLAWEANGSWYRWSPCASAGGTASDYRAMWHRYHDRYAALGVGSDRLAWIFSVNQSDTSTKCRAESLYPGDAYVDWTGVDGYTWSLANGPSAVFGPMTARLRAVAPSRPVSVNEAGAASATSGGKSAYITRYFEWLRDNDIRMALWFNVDKERDWAVFGGALGDEVFRSGTSVFTAWKAYRQGVSNNRIVGSDRSNPRLLTDAQFLGR